MSATESPESAAEAPGEAHFATSVPVELLGVLVSLMPDAAFVVASNGRIVSMNSGALDLFGYLPDQLVGQTLETLVPERLRSRHIGYRSEYAEAPRNRPMGADLDLIGRRQDGSEFPVDVSLAPVRADEQPFVVAAVRDATARKAAAAAQAQLATIVRTSLDAIISMNLEGEITSWNPAAESLLGYAAAEMIGRRVTTLVPDAEARQVANLFASTRDGHNLGALDTRWIHRDGHELDVAVSVSLLRERDDSLLGFSSIVRDITERKQSEARLRRLLAEEHRLERQHAAMSELRLALLSNTRLEDSMTLICQLACTVLEVASGLIAWQSAGELQIIGVHAVGATPARIAATVRIGRSFAEHVLSHGTTMAVDSLNEVLEVPRSADVAGGPALGVPIVTDGDDAVVLILVREKDQHGFESADVVYAKALGDQAVLALELQLARQDREELVLLGDRERIARDLHDVVIQRLFAAGMGLQSAIPLIEDPRGREKVSQAIDDLDRTITEVRNTIFSIAQSASGASSLRAQIMEIAKDAREALGFDPEVSIEGAVDTAVSDDVAAHVLAVVREGLSNAARHAHASSVQLQVSALAGEIAVRVADNGVGLGAIARESGLANLRERALMVGGTFHILPAPGRGGTIIEWRAPTTR